MNTPMNQHVSWAELASEQKEETERMKRSLMRNSYAQNARGFEIWRISEDIVVRYRCTSVFFFSSLFESFIG